MNLELIELACLLLAASSLKQIHEEWTTRGLTDTSATSLLLLIAGSGLIVWQAWRAESWASAVALAGPCLIGMALLWLKARDRVRTRRRR